MSEITALKQVARMADEAPKPKTINVTATGKPVDISRGYKVQGPDGVKIPFKPETPLAKAKEWTKNFYAPDKDYKVEKLEKMDNDFGDYYTIEYAANGVKGPKGKASRISFEQRDDGAYHVAWSNTKLEHRGKGIGAGLYRQLFEKAKKEGVPVKSDNVMTQESIAVWERFKELGYPIKKNPVKTMGPGKFMAEDKHGAIYEYDPGPTQSHINSAVKQLKTKDVPPELREAVNTELLAWHESKDPAAGRELMARIERIATKADDQAREKAKAELKGTEGKMTPKEAEVAKKPTRSPGLYLDEESGEYYRILRDGSIHQVEVKDGASTGK